MTPPLPQSPSRAALLSTAYFGPVQWFQKLHRYPVACIDPFDLWVKQTYRNRCIIAATHGLQALTVPIVHDPDVTLTRDIRISDHGNWRHLHWNALRSAYGESPFFEFYADDLAPFFERRWEFLVDFNEAIAVLMCQLLDIDCPLTTANCPLTTSVPSSQEKCPDDGMPPQPDFDDFREAIRPKHPLPDPSFTTRRYYQVFEQKHGFLPNLSILDLLMNMGNESVLYL